METTRHSRPLAVLATALVLGGCATPFGGSETADEPGEEGHGAITDTVHSKLVMRVAPGTLFEPDREVRGWYAVIAEEGIACLREGDDRPLSTEGADRG